MSDWCWTQTPPSKAEYYWAVPANRDDWLDGSPEIVKVYYNGRWSVIRPGVRERARLSDFVLWSDRHVPMPAGGYE